MTNTSLDIAPFWPDMHFYEELDSTNEELRRMHEQGKVRHGSVVQATFQHAGKGQQGSRWLGKKNENLFMSLLLQGQVPVGKQYQLNKAICLALINQLESLGLEASIKWPNDILINRTKVAGILIENAISGNAITRSIVGIGLNVWQRDFENLPHASSLSYYATELPSLSVLRDSLLENINRTLQWTDHQIGEAYADRLWVRNEFTTFEHHGRLTKGKVIGVSPIGALIVEVDGQQKEFVNKELEWKGW